MDPSAISRQVVLITGSSRGLGAATAKAFRREGASVVINYKSSSAAAKILAAEIGAFACQADVTDIDQVRGLFEAAERHFKAPISVVVNNALADFKFNGDARKGIASIEWADFDHQLRGAVQAAMNTTKAALPGFERLGRGRIVNIGSNLVLNPVVPYLDYNTAKGALLSFTRSIAAELGPMNVTCNLVAGGLLDSTDASAATPRRVFDQVAAITPLRKVTTPDDLTGAILLLAGSSSCAITGQQLATAVLIDRSILCKFLAAIRAQT